MKRILVKSVYDAFDYAMDHFYPQGLEDAAERKDSYAVISIQDTSAGGFGFRFAESETCKDVLTLFFDDIDREVEGATLFSEEQADEIIDFVRKNKDVDTLLIHCHAGESRSRAVGAFCVELFGADSKKYFETGNPNMHVYNTLKNRLAERRKVRLP